MAEDSLASNQDTDLTEAEAAHDAIAEHGAPRRFDCERAVALNYIGGLPQKLYRFARA